MADTATTVYDATAPNLKAIFTKSAGAGSTYFLGVGNILYFTNGIDNKQVSYDPATGTWGPVTDWGITAPTTAPVASQSPRPAPPPNWQAGTVYAEHLPARGGVTIYDPSGGYLHTFNGTGTTGAAIPNPFNNVVGQTTPDNQVTWTNIGINYWQNGHVYAVGDVVRGESFPSAVFYLYVATTAGTSAGVMPAWQPSLGLQQQDNQVVWTNAGKMLQWGDIGPSTQITSVAQILDTNGYLQNVVQSGKSGNTPPTAWQTGLSAQTTDNGVIWVNVGPFAVTATAPVMYGYEFMNSKTDDISNMSPPSAPISVLRGNQVVVQGDGSTQPGVDTVVIFRTAQGGSTFLYLDQIPNPPAGVKWTYTDNIPDADLNTEWEAQVAGEGTPLPSREQPVWAIT